MRRGVRACGDCGLGVRPVVAVIAGAVPEFASGHGDGDGSGSGSGSGDGDGYGYGYGYGDGSGYGDE